MEIKLLPPYYNYLNLFLKIEREDLYEQLEEGKLNNNLFYVDEEWMSSVRDWAGERLQRIGFDENYDLTRDGEFLEDLIDLLFV